MKMITRKITHLLATTAVAVVFQFSGGLNGGTFQGVSKAQAQGNLMYSRGYGYCDAKKVASVWNISISQAKAVIDDKIRNNRENLLRADIANSRTGCSWSEVQITYRDAENLARYWGISTNDAKTKAKAFVNDWGKKRFRDWARRQAGVRLS